MDVVLVTVRVSNVERALRFYRDQLGLPLIHTDGTFHEFDTGTARLAIDTGGVAGEQTGRERCPVEIHLGVADIQATRAALTAADVPFDGATRAFAYGKFARFHDPDGNPLVLFEPGDCPLRAANGRLAGESVQCAKPLE
jgi:catechol 2,3-dioxygenase-like lactoylglutathione lyase family enzyme